MLNYEKTAANRDFRHISTFSAINDVVENLRSTLSDAGGGSSIDEITDMSVIDFILQIMANNGIRFTFKKPEPITEKSVIV